MLKKITFYMTTYYIFMKGNLYRKYRFVNSRQSFIKKSYV